VIFLKMRLHEIATVFRG